MNAAATDGGHLGSDLLSLTRVSPARAREFLIEGGDGNRWLVATTEKRANVLVLMSRPSSVVPTVHPLLVHFIKMLQVFRPSVVEKSIFGGSVVRRVLLCNAFLVS